MANLANYVVSSQRLNTAPYMTEKKSQSTNKG